MPAPVVHVEIMGPDANALNDFYGKMFDWELNVMPEMNYAIAMPTGEGGVGVGIGADPEQPTRVTVYMQVPDLDEALGKAESLGGHIVMPPTVIPDMVTFALFSDPAGNVVGLVKG